MALSDLELSLMSFPQRWDGASGILHVNLLVLPTGDPTAPLGGGPVFAGTAISLLANVVSGLDALPTSATIPDKSISITATPSAVAPALFGQLFSQLVAKGITVTGTPVTNAPPPKARIRKSLPDSYVNAFAFEPGRSGDVSVGDGYCCSLRDQVPPLNTVPAKPDNAIGWGQVLSYALHQPVLARAMGLIYSFSVEVTGLLDAGGFLYFTLDASVPTNPWVADWLGKADRVKSYGARIPQLNAAQPRQVFAATLLPIVTTPANNLSTAQFEAEQYDDGFAQIVHCNQPATIDAATLQANQIAPGTDSGIQVGWDDEQVTIWFNNQVDLLRDRVLGTANTAEAPLGVLGYRVDVRLKGTTVWSSLSVVNGSLPFDLNVIGGQATTSIAGNEFWVAPAPIRPGTADNSTNDQPAWLPLYFAQWNGTSLVLPDPAVKLLAYAVSNVNGTLPAPVPANPSADLSLVPNLRYGDDYEFRVRLVDLTGGGPLAMDKTVHGGPAPRTVCKFRRFVPPKALEIEASPGIAPYPAIPSAVRTIQTLEVRRPRIGYPEAVFAGVDPKTYQPAILSPLIQDAWASGRSIAVEDPDVDSLDVRVEARIPAHDTGVEGIDEGDLDGNFRVIYSVNVPFPVDVQDDQVATLVLAYTDGIDDIALLTAPPDGTTTLPIPTGRDVRIRLYPRCVDKPNYYASDRVLVGLSTDFVVRKDAATEDAIFSNSPETQLQAFYFQFGTNVPQLLAQQLGLNQQAFTLSSATGLRTVFGASGALRHTIAADVSSITFSNQTELLGHWIVALVLDLERDWTWDGFGTPALRVSRAGADIGVVAFPWVVAVSAAGNPGQDPDRTRTRIVFFDAIDPHPAPGTFPAELNAHYTVSATFDVAASQQFNFSIRLPITTIPHQTPKVASTGIAESPYRHADDYSSTSLRDRYLWVEFAEAIEDPDDIYFGRVLAYGPDPLLAADLLPGYRQMLADSVEPALPIDPEPMRRIFSGQSEDLSGLDAMTVLVPSTSQGVGKSGRFYLLPLPQGLSPESLELFGFWTYEFRVGHRQRWSTAQGRYGRAVRVVGLQHPTPHLTCTVHRDAQQIFATAPYATGIYNGRRVYDLLAGDPLTQIWFMLYAQVLQADGASYRNVLLAHVQGRVLRDSSVYASPTHGLPPNPAKLGKVQHTFNRDPRAGRFFSQKEIESLLREIGLPATTSVSVLAVEVLPGNVPAPRDSIRGVQSDVSATAVMEREDPLGADLGSRRILRTSPLTAVPSQC